jgi:hypothetical protein
VRPDRLRGIVARWRRARYAATGRLGPGPAWCWLTRPGLAVTGQRYAPARPALARLAHIRAVLAIRLSLQDSDAWAQGRAWWRSERRIRAAAGGHVGGGHVPDAEVSWPDQPANPEHIQAALYQAFDIQALYKDDMHQVSFFATITTSTPHAVANIMAAAGNDPATHTPDPAQPPPPARPSPPPFTL